MANSYKLLVFNEANPHQALNINKYFLLAIALNLIERSPFFVFFVMFPFNQADRGRRMHQSG